LVTKEEVEEVEAQTNLLVPSLSKTHRDIQHQFSQLYKVLAQYLEQDPDRSGRKKEKPGHKKGFGLIHPKLPPTAVAVSLLTGSTSRRPVWPK
jgi:hypothetical protein